MIENYSLEIDFLPVGEESRSGDAIAIRFGHYKDSKWNNQKVFVIDGGNSESGSALVSHIKNVYKTNKVDRIFLTHPDADHASGLRNVIEELQVEKIWMHRPWKYWNDLKDSIVDGRITKNSFSERMREAYQFAHDIEQLAIQKKIEIHQPKQGTYYHIDNEKIITVLGPSKNLYLNLIQCSGKTPDMGINQTKSFSISQKKYVYENLDFNTEHLSETYESTSPENDMSLVMLLTVANARILLTGDAGCKGLSDAIEYARINSIDLDNLNIFHIPHHGSRHNLTKSILKSIKSEIAMISCAKKGEPNHPSKLVTNSLIRRNMKTFSTKGKTVYFYFGAVPFREGYIALTPIELSNLFEMSID